MVYLKTVSSIIHEAGIYQLSFCWRDCSIGELFPNQTNGLKFINCQFNGTTRSASGTGGATIHPNVVGGVFMITSDNIYF